MRMRLLAVAAMAVWSVAAMGQAGADEKKDVVAVVQRCFDAMAAHDAAGFRATLMPGTQFYAVRADGTVGTTAAEQAAVRFGEMKEAVLERMWNPTVLVSGRVATVWAEYDFHRGGKFSHCGVDAVHLVETQEGWKIASIAYTVQTQGCAPSPLGEVKP